MFRCFKITDKYWVFKIGPIYKDIIIELYVLKNPYYYWDLKNFHNGKSIIRDTPKSSLK